MFAFESMFKNITLLQSSDFPRWHSLEEPLRLNLHKPIDDDQPKEISVGWSSHSSETEQFFITSPLDDVVMLRLLIESRDIDAKIREKRVDKKVKELQADGTILDDEQIAKIRNEIRLEMLSQAVSHYSAVYVLIDYTTGFIALSSTANADVLLAKSALKQLADESSIHYVIEMVTGDSLTNCIRHGAIGNGIELSGSVVGKYGKCKLKLENADLSSEALCDVLRFFEFSEATFSCFIKTDKGYSWRYVSGKLKANGDLCSLAWSIDNETLDEICDRADYDNAMFMEFIKLLRQLLGQLVISFVGFDEYASPEWILDVANRTPLIEEKTILSPGIDHELYATAKAHVINANVVSISALQRDMKIGYSTASSLIELLEKNGVVSEPNDLGIRSLLNVKLGSAAVLGESHDSAD